MIDLVHITNNLPLALGPINIVSNTMDLVWLSCLGYGRGLVSGSTILSFVGTLHIFTSPLSMIFRMRWKHLSMCLDLWCDLGSLAWAIAPLLSQYKFNGSDILGKTPSLVMNFLIHTASLAASEAAIYSASVVESATVSCLELL